MGLTIAPVAKNVVGAQFEVIADITFDSSYPTGGESLTAATLFGPSFGAGVVTTILYVSAFSTTVPAVNDFFYDYTNKLLMAFVQATGVEVADTTSLATNIVRVMARGQGHSV